jgi:hypothetical protein
MGSCTLIFVTGAVKSKWDTETTMEAEVADEGVIHRIRYRGGEVAIKDGSTTTELFPPSFQRADLPQRATIIDSAQYLAAL